MATYLLRNTLNPSKVVSCTITFRQLTNKGDNGEPIWVVEIRTLEPHKNGGDILPVYINYTSSDNLDLAIKEATNEISKQIDWSPLDEDTRAPYISSISPEIGDVVNINSNLTLNLKELLPSDGIDLSSISININGIDVTNELNISGTPYEYSITWNPPQRILDYYL